MQACRNLMSISRLIFLALCSTFLLISATSSAEKKDALAVFQTITPKDAFHLIKSRKNLQVVDVRTARERANVVITPSTHVEMSELYRNRKNLDPQQPVLLYCAVGGRSYTASQWLRQYGFTEVYNLDGGIVAWQKAGFAIEKGK